MKPESIVLARWLNGGWVIYDMVSDIGLFGWLFLAILSTCAVSSSVLQFRQIAELRQTREAYIAMVEACKPHGEVLPE